jgi:hypothetical protein
MPTKKRILPPPPAEALPSPVPSDNLETHNDRLKVYSLQTLVLHRRDDQLSRKPEPVTLAAVLGPWLKKNVQRPAAQLEPVIEQWTALVPAAISDRATLRGMAKGTLTVALPHATAKVELDALLRRSLLADLRTQTNGIVQRVRTVVDGQPIPVIS